MEKSKKNIPKIFPFFITNLHTNADGACQILFMRKEKMPDKSFITAEIRNGKIAQAKRARNKDLSQTEKDVLNKWIDAVNKKYA